MQCPRCDGNISTYSFNATGETAVVCEACGFTGIATTHESETTEIESWDRAMRRFERTEQSTGAAFETGRADSVAVPGERAGPKIDSEALDESVAVAVALEESADDETPDTDPEALDKSVAVAALEDSSER